MLTSSTDGYINVYNNTDPDFDPFGDNTDTAGNAQPYTPASGYGENYLGCYSDIGPRTLTGASTSGNNMSIEVCQAFCSRGSGYQYFGMEFGQQCWCGNGIAGDGKLLTPESSPSNGTCQMRCRGKGDQVCGGPSVLSMYNNTAYSAPMQRPRVGRYIAQGCVADPNQGGRAIQGASISNANMTNERCVKFCLGKGFHYVGIEYGQECYCGNEIQTSRPGVQMIDCPVLSMITCPKNIKQFCGAPGVISLWYNPDIFL